MDWILAHPDDDGSMPEPEPSAMHVDAPEGGAEGLQIPNILFSMLSKLYYADGEINADQATAQSLKCDECGKLFKDASKAEFHAVKSGHQSFSESTEAVKPLVHFIFLQTPEEKAAKLLELQERLKAKREEKRRLELQEEKEREKVRRYSHEYFHSERVMTVDHIRSSAREVQDLKEKYKVTF
jgi:UBX domain-containing protein 1/4